MSTYTEAWKSYNDFAAWTKSKFENINSEFDKIYFIRELSLSIFDLDPIYTGLVSESGQGLAKYKLCREHFFTRKQSAELIYKLLSTKKKMSVSRLSSILMSRNRVNLVTKQENQILRKYQTDSNIKSWRQEYAAAGIKLVPHVPVRSRKNNEI